MMGGDEMGMERWEGSGGVEGNNNYLHCGNHFGGYSLIEVGHYLNLAMFFY